jgi:hypothetical protein
MVRTLALNTPKVLIKMLGWPNPGSPAHTGLGHRGDVLSSGGGRYLGPGQVCSPTLPLTNTARGGAQSRTLPLTDPGEVDLGQDGLGVLPPALANFQFCCCALPGLSSESAIWLSHACRCYQAFGLCARTVRACHGDGAALVREVWRMDGAGGGDRLTRRSTAGLCTRL